MLEPHDEIEEGLGGGAVRVMDDMRPTEALGVLGNRILMSCELFDISFAQAFDTVGDPAIVAFRSEKLGTALVRQGFLGRIQHLNQMTTDSGGGKCRDTLVDVVGGIEKVTKDDDAGKA